VWSGAWPSTKSVDVPAATGLTTHTPWSTWIVSSVMTSVEYEDVKTQTVVGTSVYTASWGEVYETPSPGLQRW
jgi:cellulase